MSLGFGALSRERCSVIPLSPSPSYPTQLMRCVTCVGCALFGSEEVGDGGRQPVPSWEARQCPLWITLQVYQRNPAFWHVPVLIGSHFSGILLGLMPPSVCLNFSFTE